MPPRKGEERGAIKPLSGFALQQTEHGREVQHGFRRYDLIVEQGFRACGFQFLLL